MQLETERLVLRDLTLNDYGALRRIMDTDTMWAYGHAFSDRDVAEWLAKQMDRRETWGFSLCAVEIKATGEMIGQCGLTVQPCLGGYVPEVGYVFSRECWNHGYATEAALAIRNWAFDTLGVGAVYAMIRDINYASRRVAVRLGMTPCGATVKHYRGMDMLHIVYRINRDQEITNMQQHSEARI